MLWELIRNFRYNQVILKLWLARKKHIRCRDCRGLRESSNQEIFEISWKKCQSLVVKNWKRGKSGRVNKGMEVASRKCLPPWQDTDVIYSCHQPFHAMLDVMARGFVMNHIPCPFLTPCSILLPIALVFDPACWLSLQPCLGFPMRLFHMRQCHLFVVVVVIMIILVSHSHSPSCSFHSVMPNYVTRHLFSTVLSLWELSL